VTIFWVLSEMLLLGTRHSHSTPRKLAVQK
jgi:hypothetical protein